MCLCICIFVLLEIHSLEVGLLGHKEYVYAILLDIAKCPSRRFPLGMYGSARFPIASSKSYTNGKYSDTSRVLPER